MENKSQMTKDFEERMKNLTAKQEEELLEEARESHYDDMRGIREDYNDAVSEASLE